MKLKCEMMYYKFLGVLICLCPSQKLKKSLLKYANNRFPVIEQGFPFTYYKLNRRRAKGMVPPVPFCLTATTKAGVLNFCE